MNNNELMHYGVLGMKWGKRKALPTSDVRSRVNSTKNEYRTAKKAGADAEKLRSAKSAYKQAKTERNQKIKSTYKSLNKKASLGEKLTYNNNTRKKAAKYIVDNDMTVSEATKKAKGDAWRNSAAITAVYGGISVASLYMTNH